MGEGTFSRPYIDIDEWRDSPRRHRYVHGGFEDTHTRFSFYFPEAAQYEGRFLQYLEGGAGGHENLIELGYDGTGMGWLFDLAFDELGCYLVESNQGHFTGEGLGVRDDGSDEAPIHLYDASAESAARRTTGSSATSSAPGSTTSTACGGSTTPRTAPPLCSVR